MLPEILLIATLCSVDHPNNCRVIVLDEWQTITEDFEVNQQSSMDMQTDCVSSQFGQDSTVRVESFQCYKMVIDDAQGFTVQSLNDGSLITIFYADYWRK